MSDPTELSNDKNVEGDEGEDNSPVALETVESFDFGESQGNDDYLTFVLFPESDPERNLVDFIDEEE